MTGDEVYGGDPSLRAALEARRIGYVLAVAPSPGHHRSGEVPGGTLATRLPKRAWQQLSAGAGAKGHRFYNWACIDLAPPPRGR